MRFKYGMQTPQTTGKCSCYPKDHWSKCGLLTGTWASSLSRLTGDHWEVNNNCCSSHENNTRFTTSCLNSDFVLLQLVQFIYKLCIFSIFNKASYFLPLSWLYVCFLVLKCINLTKVKQKKKFKKLRRRKNKVYKDQNADKISKMDPWLCSFENISVFTPDELEGWAEEMEVWASLFSLLGPWSIWMDGWH